MLITGAQVLIECLREQKVDMIFGFPGGTVLPIYDALYDAKDITHILTAHEQGATHAADGYSRVTGKVGVIIATSGPGATNTVTGIATAYSDSVPLVIITGQVSLDLLGKDSFQEVDIISITKAITKKNYIVKDVNKLAETIREAFEIAREGRPGPVLVDIPKDVQNTKVEYEKVENLCTSNNSRGFLDKEHSSSLEEVIKAINACKKPVIYAGGGIVSGNASKELIEFAEKIKSPVTCSLMGIGAFPGDHPSYTGMVGMHGSKCSNLAINNSDLLIAIGARFSDRVVSDIKSFAKDAKVLHIDIDSNELGKNVEIDYSLCGDCKGILDYLTKAISDREENSWNEKIEEWKMSFPVKSSNIGELNPQLLMEKLHDTFDESCIVTTEVGQNQMWAAQFFTFKEPRHFVTSGGLGTMGYGLGAAIGASIGRPDLRVINVAGDGSFKMNSIELATISKYQLPIIQLVMNNHALGMVRQWQDMFYGKRFSQTTLGPDVDFIKLAGAYGIKAIKITKNEEIDEKLRLAKEYNGPILIECDIHPDEKIFPIVPPGAPITESIS